MENGELRSDVCKSHHSQSDKCNAVIGRRYGEGETWSAHGDIKSPSAGWLIENAIAQLEPSGDLLMIFRTRQGGLCEMR